MRSRALILLPFLLLLGVAFAQPEGTTFASGLNGPMGLLVAPDGAVWVVDSGVGGEDTLEFQAPGTDEPQALPYGMSSRVVRIDEDGTQHEVATLPSLVMGQEVSGGSRLAWHDGAVYATSGAWLEAGDIEPPDMLASIVRIDPDTGETTVAADTWAIEDEQNPDGHIKESHPYGIVAGPDGMLYVADAGANDLLRVDPASGDVSLVTVFEGVPGMFPNELRGGAQENDPVPTGITVGADGELYVSFLPGFPPVPGSSRVVRVGLDGETTEVAGDMTVLTDLQAAPDGALYAVQLAEFGEQGPEPMSGRVMRIENGEVSEVLSGLSFPSGIAFAPDGTAYVTINSVGAPGSGEIHRYEGLAAAR